MRKDQIKLGKVAGIPPVIYAGTFDDHMRFGDQKGGSHSGLHVISEFKKANGAVLGTADVLIDREYTGRIAKKGGEDKAATVSITDVDPRAQTFRANVSIYGAPKTSTFFPAGTTLAKAKEYIEEAWRDHCTFGSSNYGGGDVDIYRQMRDRFGLSWVGLATIGLQRVWVGSDKSGSLEKAFPAVNNRFA